MSYYGTDFGAILLADSPRPFAEGGDKPAQFRMLWRAVWRGVNGVEHPGHILTDGFEAESRTVSKAGVQKAPMWLLPLNSALPGGRAVNATMEDHQRAVHRISLARVAMSMS